jgi:hypothetical protein
VRRHERDHHRVEPPDEHRAAVREVVGRRAERRRADDAVAGQHAEILAADGVAELDHAPEPGARREDVVDRRSGLPADPNVERRKPHHGDVAYERALEARLQLARLHRRQEADAPEVDADHGYVGAEKAVEGAQHRAVPAQRDGEVGPAVVFGHLDALRLGEPLDAGNRVGDPRLVVVRDDGDAFDHVR